VGREHIGSSVDDFFKEDAMLDKTDLEIYEEFVDSMIQMEGTQKEELSWATLGLTSEAGEVAGELEKMLRKNEPIDAREDKIFDEVSDVLFYCSAVLRALGRTMDECIEHNIDKLVKRHG
jgi:NTP pyrophosphatase (non-canonical NTP hydrolase)